MGEIWDENEELGAEDELVVTEQRDRASALDSAEETAVETTVGDPAEVLEELGEDVASSAAQRGREHADG